MYSMRTILYEVYKPQKTSKKCYLHLLTLPCSTKRHVYLKIPMQQHAVFNIPLEIVGALVTESNETKTKKSNCVL